MVSPQAAPEPPPAALRAADDDGVAVATVGTTVFAIALGICLLRRADLIARGDQWWIWTSASGVVVGLIFRTFASRRARAYREHAATGDSAVPPPASGGR